MIYCTICGKVFDGTWRQALSAGWKFLKVAGIVHVKCPEDANKKIEGE